MIASFGFKFYLAALFCPCLLAVVLSFFARRGFKFTPPRTARFSVLRLCLSAAPSTDGICRFMWAASAFQRAKNAR